jgi:hypothetical protein
VERLQRLESHVQLEQPDTNSFFRETATVSPLRMRSRSSQWAMLD